MPDALTVVDGQVLPASEATISISDEGLLRGDGVFEVLCVYDGKPFALDDHLAQMVRSAGALRLEIDINAVRADALTLLDSADPGDVLLRLLVTRGGRRIGLIEPMPQYPPTIALASVEYVPTRVLDQIKSLSYAANMLATRLAKERGGDEALLVTPHGRVLEGPTSSLFCSLDGETLVTPPLDDHVLDSITRRRLLTLIEVREAPITTDELAGATEAFLASTTREVHSVHAIDGRALPAAPGPLTEQAAAAFRAHIQAELA